MTWKRGKNGWGKSSRGTSAHARRLLLLPNKRNSMLSSSRHLVLFLVLHLALSVLILNSRGAKVSMRTYHGVDGRMLFTYAQLSPGGKEGSEEESSRTARGEEEGGGEAKVHCVASEWVREKERVKGFDVSSRFGDAALGPSISGVWSSYSHPSPSLRPYGRERTAGVTMVCIHFPIGMTPRARGCIPGPLNARQRQHKKKQGREEEDT